MNVIKLARKYPQFGQEGIFSLQDTFNRSDNEDRGYLDEATTIRAAQELERKPYDEVRAALKQVELDSSRRVELDDFVDVSAPISGALFGAACREPTLIRILRSIADLQTES
jgi:plastin-1